jgi:prolyl-tRNA synthetase
LARRDNLTKESVSIEGLENYIEELLKTIQKDIYNKALTFREENITKVDSYEDFKKVWRKKGDLSSLTGTELKKKKSRSNKRDKSDYQMYSFE